MDDSDVDDFFEGVAGKPKRGRPMSASQRLGATVRTAVLKRREAADNTLSVADDIKRDALLNSLAERGLFRDPTPVKSTPPPRRRSTPQTFARWSRPISLAAVLAVCAVGVVQLLPRSQVAPVVVERGPAALTVRSDDPAGSARELTRQVTQAGAEAQSVQINDSTWTVTIDLPRTASGKTDTDVRERVRRTLNMRGVKAPDADSFSVVVESTQHR
jgi:hypothetical protein